MGYAVIEVDTPTAASSPSLAPDEVDVTWLHRTTRPQPGLAGTVRALPWLDGRVDVFVHGEAQTVMQEIRPYLLRERGVARRTSRSPATGAGPSTRRSASGRPSSPPPRAPDV